MTQRCVTCGEPIQAGDYRLVGVEHGSWLSRYAHRGTCEADARRPRASGDRATRRQGSEPVPEVEELTMEEPDPFPDEGLPWFGIERRR